MIKNLIEFIKTGIWLKRDEDYKSKRLRWGARQFKIFIITAKGFGAHSLAIRSAALTFYTLMSIVPIAALVFGILKGFGVEVQFLESLHTNMPQYAEVIDTITEFANNMLSRTRGGIIIAIGLVVLLWAVLKVFGNIESAFNHIWEVHKSRSVTRKLSDYLTVVFIAPILWVASNSLAIYLKATITRYTGSTILEILYGLASLLAVWTMFTFIYKVMPNTKVKLNSAINAGVVAGTIFQIFQVAYLIIQTEVTSYNAIYGSFAALPLFLMWMQISWHILFFGAELSFAYQNIYSYEQEMQLQNLSYNTRLKVLISIFAQIINQFKNNNGATSSESIASTLRLPMRLVQELIYELETANLVCAVRDSSGDEKVSLYIPARDINSIRIADVVEAVQNYGTNLEQVDYADEITQVGVIIDQFNQNDAVSDKNMRLIDIGEL